MERLPRHPSREPTLRDDCEGWALTCESHSGFGWGNRAQVFVDGANIVIAQVLKVRPRHYLQQLTRVVEVFAGTQNRSEFGKGVSGRESILGREVAGYEGAERHSASKVVRGVDLLLLAKEGIASRGEVRIRVAIVAAAHGVHEIASQANELGILVYEIQADRRNFEAFGDAALFDGSPIMVIVGSSFVLKHPQEGDGACNCQDCACKMLHTLSPFSVGAGRAYRACQGPGNRRSDEPHDGSLATLHVVIPNVKKSLRLYVAGCQQGVG
jgi:hypothetical protein